MVKDVAIGCWLMATVVGLCFGSYKLGYSDGTNNVISACSYYKKYGIDGTQELICSAVVKPEELVPSVEESNAKWYSKENKDKHRKDRK